MEKDFREQVEMTNGIEILPKEIVKSVCEMYRKCKTCLLSYKVKEEVQHKCGHGQCSNCLEYVDLYQHKCYIVSDCYRDNKRLEIKHKAEQRCLEAIKLMSTTEGGVVQDVARKPITFKDLEEEMRERPPLQERVGPTRQETTDRMKKELQYLGVDITTIPDNKVEDFYSNHFQWAEPKNTEKELVFADIECTIDDSRTFTPNLICFERETSDEKYHFWGKSCIREFINQLKAWIKPTRGRLQFHSFFHNFRGFDGLFIIKQLYDMNLKVSKVLTTGQKILYFECGNLKFKDSMSFLNMPLEKFTDTFKLSELKKGYFPHKFNTAENEN